MKLTQPKPNSIFDFHNPKGIKLITRLHLGISHLREHKLYAQCSRFSEPYLYLRLWNWNNYSLPTSLSHLLKRKTEPSGQIHEYQYQYFKQNDTITTIDLLLGNTFPNDILNTFVLGATIDYLFSTKILDAATCFAQ